VTVQEAREELELQIATLVATTAAHQAMNTPLQNVTKEREATVSAIDALVAAVREEAVAPAIEVLEDDLLDSTKVEWAMYKLREARNGR
jgi:hypothetical protein